VRHGENEVRLQALHRACPQQPTPAVVKLEGEPAASVKPGQKSCVRSSGISHCRHEGLVTVWDEARLGQSCNDDQSHWGLQCNETTLTGQSRFTYVPPRRFEPRSLERHGENEARLQALHMPKLWTDIAAQHDEA
jgi:hypothetical protein